jgi:tol-pal system protein YbgF
MKFPYQKLLASTFLATALSFPAIAQDLEMQDLIDRLERMDRDIKALNLKVYRGTDAVSAVTPSGSGGGGEVSGPLGARLSVRINELENQMRQMTGQIEETAYRISQLNTRLDKLVADVDYRLTALEGGNPAARPMTDQQVDGTGEPQQVGSLQGQELAPPTGGQTLTPPAPGQGVLGTLTQEEANSPISPVTPKPTVTQLPATTTVQPATPTVPAVETANLTPEEVYQNSRQMLMRGELAQAETSFKDFLVSHKDHKLTGNVRYWLGETYYVQGDFAQAAATFLEGYQKAPRGAKAPDSLLKLGMSLTRMEKLPEACATYKKLRTDFPKMPAHLSKTLERERSSAKCK